MDIWGKLREQAAADESHYLHLKGPSAHNVLLAFDTRVLRASLGDIAIHIESSGVSGGKLR